VLQISQEPTLNDEQRRCVDAAYISQTCGRNCAESGITVSEQFEKRVSGLPTSGCVSEES